MEMKYMISSLSLSLSLLCVYDFLLWYLDCYTFALIFNEWHWLSCISINVRYISSTSVLFDRVFVNKKEERKEQMFLDHV